jgi:anti-anti-sigma factor
VQPFALTETELRSDCREIHVAGELDLAVAGQLADALERAATERDEVMIDLGDCEFIDSTGIAAIVKAYRRAHERGGRVAVYGASAQVRRILAVTGLTENGLVFDALPEALDGQS